MPPRIDIQRGPDAPYSAVLVGVCRPEGTGDRVALHIGRRRWDLSPEAARTIADALRFAADLVETGANLGPYMVSGDATEEEAEAAMARFRT